ncbi:SDR family NAD(P)-dependent oxidoreductase [Arthrobacter sp. HY1533]|uniref:SDR family NAD(P)-dependent oxidoreductase n=1 Tax=Arthrobacter sp. HY1533 TaxID=2970919 RepID=UPI0022B9EA62|nr:SDR family NAD(P)-dependent oxidoreductase [Arthrobacter sp. HY1533]
MLHNEAQIYPRFAGKVVLVTGAGTGLGAEIAVRAAKEGAQVAVHFNRSRAGAEETLDRVREAGSHGIVVQADISCQDQVERMADDVFEAFGELDVLVNNAGDVAGNQLTWRELTQGDLDTVIDVNVKGTLLMTHEFGQRMVAQGRGVIINVGSTVIVHGSSRAPHYVASKYAIVGITKSYALAFAPSVRVNTFAPGSIETEQLMNRRDWASGRREALLSHTPMGVIPLPEHIAGACLWLATDEAAHLTGGFVPSDGGYTMVGA